MLWIPIGCARFRGLQVTFHYSVQVVSMDAPRPQWVRELIIIAPYSGIRRLFGEVWEEY